MKVSKALLLMIPSSIIQGVTSANDYPVTDASQSQCYDTSGTVVDCTNTGQDASYNFLPQEFCDHNDDTITDMNTGLTWTKKVYGKMPYSQADDSFTLAGHSDWRLPSIKELYTLIDFDGKTGQSAETNTPYINSLFEIEYGETRHIDGQLWSSTQYVGTIMTNPTNCIFGLNLIDGRIKCYEIERPNGDINEMYVRYVRGNTKVGVNSFSLADSIVKDAATGLEWMENDSGSAMNWPAALDYCEQATYGGYSDWRLPDAHELQSIVDYTRSPSTTNSPAIDAVFQSTMIKNEANDDDFGWYWTSTTHLDGKEQEGQYAIYVAFGRAMGLFTNIPNGTPEPTDVHGAGAQRSDPKVTLGGTPDAPQGDYFRVENFVRCVRGKSSPSSSAPTQCSGSSSSGNDSDGNNDNGDTDDSDSICNDCGRSGATMKRTGIVSKRCVERCIRAWLKPLALMFGFTCGSCP